MTDTPAIGVLSPGELGDMFCRSLLARGYRVGTFVEDRSETTRQRASDAGVERLDSMQALVRESDIVVSLVPPAFAVALAENVAGALRSVDGAITFVDANSISPRTTAQLEQLLTSAGSRYVDASVMTLPRTQEPRMYVCGPDRGDVLALGADDFRVIDLGERIGRASRLKMCFSFMTKSTIAIWMVMLAAAESSGLRDELIAELELSDDPLSQASISKRIARISGSNMVSRRAGRWEGELREAQSAFEDLDLATLAAGAREVFSALAEIHGSDLYPGRDDAERLAALLEDRLSKSPPSAGGRKALE